MEKITAEQRFIRASAVGVAGLITALAITFFDGFINWEGRFIRCATAGAFLAGLLVARGFGGQGSWGWLRAAVSFAAATILGAIIAVMLLPFDEAYMRTEMMQMMTSWAGVGVFGPVYVFGSICEYLGVGLAWVVAFSGIQVSAQRYLPR